MLAPLPVSSVSVLACRDTLAAVVATQLSGSFPDDPDPRATAGPHEIVVRTDGLPKDVAVLGFSALPSFAVETYAPDLDTLHDAAVGRAWRDGAWDIAVSLLPPLDGSALGLVDAFRDWEFSALPVRDQLIDAARAGRLVYWLHKPMHHAPEIRIRAHAHKDVTLAPDCSRPGRPSALRRPNWMADGGRQWLIRLGASTKACRPAPRPRAPRLATARQMRYVAALRRRLRLQGSIGPLSVREASREIDRLLIALGDVTPL